MKPNWIRIIIAICIAAFAVWGIVAISPYEATRLPLGIVSGLTLATGLLLLLGFDSGTRTMVSGRVAGTIYVIFAFACNMIFAFFDFSIPLYAIINGIPLLLYLLLIYSLFRASAQAG